ncbi:NUBP iron-sulfur cluster assembly factor, mitochondrial isoform X1 [Lycorma delicatula]|uniref:NUBP iron-sulfur cluster assembly factor, mitochondrial isoform X1 n=1 Tax=Lycorma delicatula TaxID=130591 RepID=UPI003F511D94
MKANLKLFNIVHLLRVSKVNVSINGTSHQCYTSRPDLEKKRAELMARGLPKQKPIPGVNNILLVASGKGGVGKSTTAVNLATAMATLQPKLEIGLLDADVFGPSIPLMMNVNESPLLTEDDLMVPLLNYGVKCMSMGFLVTERSAVMWRGLMVMSALEKLMRKVHWGNIDCLVIDTPPGTGDTHLSLIQNLPITGVVLVTTPQQAALQVVRRGITMLKKLNIPIVGIIENMSNITCPNCKTSISLFGSGTHQLAKEHGIEVLQDIPLDSDITNSGDSGKPIVVAEPDSSQALSYIQLAEKVADFLRKQSKLET